MSSVVVGETKMLVERLSELDLWDLEPKQWVAFGSSWTSCAVDSIKARCIAAVEASLLGRLFCVFRIDLNS